MTKIDAIEGIGTQRARKLAKIGVETVEELLKQGAYPSGRRRLARKTGISVSMIEHWVCMADLFRIKGVASEYAELLYAAGARVMQELAQARAAELTQAMHEADEESDLVRALPSQSRVAEWIRQSKRKVQRVYFTDSPTTPGERAGIAPSNVLADRRDYSSLLDWLIWLLAFLAVMLLAGLLTRAYLLRQGATPDVREDAAVISEDEFAPEGKQKVGFGQRVRSLFSSDSSSDADEGQKTTVISSVLNHSETTLFAALMSRSGIYDELLADDPNGVTVLAPQNDSLTAQYRTLLTGSDEELRAFVDRHIVVDVVDAAVLQSNRVFMTRAGTTVEIVDMQSKGGTRMLINGRTAEMLGQQFYILERAL